ncbi:MAG: ABC transporter permease subunit [Phycisphaera sp.]|nr:ABC transporter permease subunit [Phycisphaera sp.]
MANKRKQLGAAMLFLAPNFLGVLAFTVFPVLFSIMLAFTNWDLRLHNMFKDEPLKFVGLDNFTRLFTEADFTRYLGNTLFMMMGIPFSVGGSLLAAMLLSSDTRGGGGRTWAWLLASGGLVVSVALLAATGLATTGMTILFVGVACGILAMGMLGGVTVYRTLFYTPHFTAGVATFLLWKKLYNPESGPINAALQPVLDTLAGFVNKQPPTAVSGLRWVFLTGVAALLLWAVSKLCRMWNEGELSGRAMVLPMVLLTLPTVVAMYWTQTRGMPGYVLAGVMGSVGVWVLLRVFVGSRAFLPPTGGEGLGTGLMIALCAMTVQFILLGFSAVFANLPAMAADGLEAPKWIASYDWAKPSLMLMGLWGAIGSNNMLLYLAALTNVPGELYEAADIDGARRFQRFWHVTWPQLAPTTFFILVMSTIGGLQGGFEMAKTMTNGGPAGATTTLSYFIFIEGFETGRLSFAAAVSWALFILVFSITMFNWRFGNKYVND